MSSSSSPLVSDLGHVKLRSTNKQPKQQTKPVQLICEGVEDYRRVFLFFLNCFFFLNLAFIVNARLNADFLPQL